MSGNTAVGPGVGAPTLFLAPVTVIDWRDWFSQADPKVEPSVRDSLLKTADKRDGGYILAQSLPETYKPEEIAVPGPGTPQRAWELIGLYLLARERPNDAISVFDSLYKHMLRFEAKTRTHTHKGMPLCWISDCFLKLGYPVLAKRYLMYTLCEDSAFYGPGKRVDESGVYFRAVGPHRIPEQLVLEYTKTANDKFREIGPACWFPERLLSELDQRWMIDYPTEAEYGQYWVNPVYVRFLLGQVGDTANRGDSLERLAHYLLSMIPGCRAYLRTPTGSSEIDVVGSFEGPSLDFRSELSRYFVCECKDWDHPADFTTFAKLARVLDSVKSRFGIVFSREGLSGKRRERFAEREQLKVFADRGIAIVVITIAHLEKVAAGESFLGMLRSEYEMVRLDLSGDSKAVDPTSVGPRPQSRPRRRAAKRARSPK
jgi:hypothetical protein